MEKGKISVIIPVRNGVKWLEECVNSILAQSYENYEVLILDDHSTDGTTQLAEKLAEKDSRVRLTQQNKNGVSNARNQGIDETDGAYITFVDADDKIDGKMFEKLHQYLEKENSDIVLCDFHKWNGNETEKSGNSVNTSEKREKTCNSENEGYSLKTVNKKKYIAEYLLRGNTRCWSILYRREVIGKVRFREDLTIGEDMMFLVDLLQNLKKISVTDYKGYYYRINQSGVMLRPFTPSYMDEIKAWRLAFHIISWSYPQQKARLASILAVSAMLVAGKLSRLSEKERLPYRKYVEECRLTVKKALQVPGAKSELPAGYGIKTALFCAWPEGYLKLYHFWKG